MPNHIVNEVRLHSVDQTEVRAIVSGDDRVIDFMKLLPLPLNFWPGNVSLLHEEAFPGTHLAAASRTWGTKWNAYALSDESLRPDGDDVILTFETAWNPPRGWVVAVFNTLKCDITHHWQDEGSDAVHCEKYTYYGDRSAIFPRWTAGKVEMGSEDHRRLYKLQWGVETPAEREEST